MPRAKKLQQRFEAAKLRKGAHSVEFAIVLPMMMLLFASGIEFARINMLRHLAENASYEAARKAIVPGNTDNDARGEALRLLSNLGVGNGATASVSRSLNSITVTVAVPISQNSWGLTRLTGGYTVTQSCSLTLEAVR